jgi:hypothetical protein
MKGVDGVGKVAGGPALVLKASLIVMYKFGNLTFQM